MDVKSKISLAFSLSLTVVFHFLIGRTTVSFLCIRLFYCKYYSEGIVVFLVSNGHVDSKLLTDCISWPANGCSSYTHIFYHYDLNIAGMIMVFNLVWKRIWLRQYLNPPSPCLIHGTLDHGVLLMFHFIQG